MGERERDRGEVLELCLKGFSFLAPIMLTIKMCVRMGGRRRKRKGTGV